MNTNLLITCLLTKKLGGFFQWTISLFLFLFRAKILYRSYAFVDYIFPVWLRFRLIPTELERVHSHTETSCIASYYRQFSTNIEINITI